MRAHIPLFRKTDLNLSEYLPLHYLQRSRQSPITFVDVSVETPRNIEPQPLVHPRSPFHPTIRLQCFDRAGYTQIWATGLACHLNF